jgi:hypothetical protein
LLQELSFQNVARVIGDNVLVAAGSPFKKLWCVFVVFMWAWVHSYFTATSQLLHTQQLHNYFAASSHSTASSQHVKTIDDFFNFLLFFY